MGEDRVEPVGATVGAEGACIRPHSIFDSDAGLDGGGTRSTAQVRRQEADLGVVALRSLGPTLADQ